MERIAKPRTSRKSSRLATSRSLRKAEMAITDGEKTIGEISEMVQLKPEKESRFESPLPDIPLLTVRADVPIDDVCRSMFGMSVAPLLFCIASIGTVAGVFIGLTLNGSKLQSDILYLLGML